MAVYTPVSSPDLAAFLSLYDLGAATGLKAIAAGVENSNYLLTTTTGRYILTLFEKRVKAADLPYFLSLMTWCAAHGLPVASAIAQKSGTALGRLCGRPAAIIAFLEGASVDDPIPRQCARVGAMLARLHIATAAFDQRRANPLSLAGWVCLADTIGTRADRCAPRLAAYIAEEVAFLRRHWPSAAGKELPVGVTHSDLFPDNVLFSGDRITGVIDFYFAADDFLAYDLAVLVNAWCFDCRHRLDKSRMQAVLYQYNSPRPLTTAETRALPLLMRGAALRFLLTRLQDWLNQPATTLVTVKNPLDYQKRLDHHRRMTDSGDDLV